MQSSCSYKLLMVDTDVSKTIYLSVRSLFVFRLCKNHSYLTISHLHTCKWDGQSIKNKRGSNYWSLNSWVMDCTRLYKFNQQGSHSVYASMKFIDIKSIMNESKWGKKSPCCVSVMKHRRDFIYKTCVVWS